ncbi:MAG TPA: alkaline phosphatase D family protein, partial [Longimicrobiaceae bacterium]
MTLHLHPRAAPGDRLRVWVGAFGRTTAPRLSWRLDGAERVPEALAPVCGARPDELAEPGERRAFTGVYEFRGAGIAPGTLHVVEALDDTGERAALECRTLPAEIPGLLENESFNVLLVSCFHADQDRNGLAGTVVSQLNGPYQPHLTLMMGDQVYLDLPVLENFPDSDIPLARKFEASYTRNWTDPLAYAEVLRAAPAVATGDDHEYWNNFPHAAPHLMNTWTAEGRARWAAAARALFGAFQLPQPEGWERAVELEVAPLSLFVMDTRTFRREDRSAVLHPAVLAQLRAWAERVAREGKFGAVLSGQSLFEDPAGV